MRLELYTDGAAINNGKAGAIGYAAVVLANGERREWSGSELADPASSNLAELRAIRLGLDEIRAAGWPVAELLVFSDSEWSIRSLKGEYRATAHSELLAAIRAALRLLPRYELCWLRGHCGHQLNERAHTLAHAAAWGTERRERCPEPLKAPRKSESPWTRKARSAPSSPGATTPPNGSGSGDCSAAQMRLDRTCWAKPEVTRPEAETAKFWEWLTKLRNSETYPTDALVEREAELRETLIPALRQETEGETSTLAGSEWLKRDLKLRRLRGQLWAIQETLIRRAGGISAPTSTPPISTAAPGPDPFADC